MASNAVTVEAVLQTCKPVEPWLRFEQGKMLSNSVTAACRVLTLKEVEECPI